MIGHIIETCSSLGRELTRVQAEQLAAYHAILIETNRTLNLTRVPDDPIEAADRNYIDSLMPYLVTDWLDKAGTLLDVGSGAGFPGIPLAIALPSCRVTMLDSLGKRVDFINRVVSELGLNAEAVHYRAEEAAKTPAMREKFDVVTARAVAYLPTLCELCLPFARVGGAFIDYHGPKADTEIPEAKEAVRMLGGGTITQVSAPVPGRDWDHRLIRINKTGHTSAAYPRKPGDPGRKPLGVPKQP